MVVLQVDHPMRAGRADLAHLVLGVVAMIKVKKPTKTKMLARGPVLAVSVAPVREMRKKKKMRVAHVVLAH